VASIISDVELQLDVAHSAGASGAFAYTDNDLLLLKTGDTQERFAVDKSGHTIRKVERASGIGPQFSTASTAVVTGRELTIVKSRADTAIRIAYSDTFRAYQQYCQWELIVDGVSCPGGELVYNFFGTSGDITPGSIFGYCDGLSAGSHQIQVQSGPVPGYTAPNSCLSGFLADRWTLEAEEVY
jgi:hypothetical protein